MFKDYPIIFTTNHSTSRSSGINPEGEVKLTPPCNSPGIFSPSHFHVALTFHAEQDQNYRYQTVYRIRSRRPSNLLFARPPSLDRLLPLVAPDRRRPRPERGHDQERCGDRAKPPDTDTLDHR